MSECLISRRGGGNSKILNLDKLPHFTFAESTLSGELTGNTSSRISSYMVKVGGKNIFPVINNVPELLGITQFKLACTSIGDYGLIDCSGLTSLDLPACSSIGSSGLYMCSHLTSIDLSACTSIGEDGLRGCSSLTSIDLSTCTSIGFYGMNSCSSLTSLDLPACTSIGEDGLRGCSSLAQVAIGSNIQTIDAYAFENTKSGIVININRAQDTVLGSPWGATDAVIHWTGDA